MICSECLVQVLVKSGRIGKGKREKPAPWRALPPEKIRAHESDFAATQQLRKHDFRSPERRSDNLLEVADAFWPTRLPIRKVRLRSRGKVNDQRKFVALIFGVGSLLAISLVEAGPPFVTKTCSSPVDAISSEILTQCLMSD